jgi:PAS domain S-box-containing protein
MEQVQSLKQRIQELEGLLEQAERKSDILTNLLKEATAEFNQALEKVSTSEANFRAIIEGAPEAIYIFDVKTHQILDCNPYTTEWLGFSRKELLSMKIEEILDPKTEGVDANIQKVMETGFVHIQERRFKKKSGTWVDAEISGMLIQIQDQKCFVALVRDITERKKIECLKRYKELFDNVIDPVFINYSQGTFLEVNDVACARLKYSRSELLTKTFSDVVPSNQHKVLRQMAQKIRSGEIVQFELEVVTRTGEVIPFEFHSRFIEFQRKPAILSVARDLSARKKMEETLIRTERLSAVGEMASGIAHNFNNLLQMMLAAGEAAIAKLNSGEIRKSRDAITTLIEACHRGADIVRRIKEFTLTNTEGLAESRVFDIGDLVAEAVQLTRPLWTSPVEPNKYRLHFIKPKNALISGNPSEMYEVLVNIIKNALEAMPDGGKLTISSRTKNGKVYLTFSDTGIGIPEAHQQRIFQPFFTTKGRKSSGLGLSSSYGIVKKHQGEMMVKSRPGKGTTFRLILPQAEQIEIRQTIESAETQWDPGTKVRFLVIDDERNILRIMEMFFESSSIEVRTANTAESGLEAIQKDRFDLIMCDFGMDGMNGLQLGKAAMDHAQQQRTVKTPFILCTGLNEALNPKALIDCGIDRVIHKPIPYEELFHIIQESYRESHC